MNTLKVANLSSVSAIAALLPLGLWAMLWFSLSSGPWNIQEIINPSSPVGFLHGLRAIFPIAAAAGAIFIILAGVSQQGPRRYLLLGPLGLAAVYGLVGLASSLLSPDKLVALYWAAAYLSVPLVLWAIVRGANAAGHLSRLINLNWLLVMVILGTAALLAVVPRYLHLESLAAAPSAFLECRLGDNWFRGLGGLLRQTGVGRYAAVAGLIALAGLWRGSWRPLWGLVLLGSLALLLSTGARTAFLAFAAAAVLVVLLYEGKRAAVAGSAVLIVLVLVAWGTGFHQSVLNSCILRGWTDPSKQSEAPVGLEVPPGNWVLAQVLPQDLGQEAEPTEIPLTPGKWTLQKSSSPQTSGSEATQSVPIKPGEWVLQPSASLPEATSAHVQSSPTAVESSTQGQPPATKESSTQAQPPATKESLSQAQPPATKESSTQAQPPATKESLSQAQPPATKEPTDSGAEVSGAARASPQGPAPSKLPGPIHVPPGEWVLGQVSPVDSPAPAGIPEGFFTFTGRTAVWAEGWKLFTHSPLLGYGFHADRLKLGQHMHNSFLHALVQTGLMGTIPFVAAILLGWVLLLKALRNLARLPVFDKHLVIQTGGILAFLTIRSIFESTGAFFGVDWLLLAPLLLYLQVVNHSQVMRGRPS